MKGFEPIYSKNSKVLILGSFPSVKSREVSFYYGNKQNRFWHIIEKVYNVKLETIEDKKKIIILNDLALWDICESCDIVGSLDSNIKNVKYVDLQKVLKPNTKVEKILCNGKKSYELTKEYLKQNKIEIKVKYMSSTSPANTRFVEENWIKELQE